MLCLDWRLKQNCRFQADKHIIPNITPAVASEATYRTVYFKKMQFRQPN